MIAERMKPGVGVHANVCGAFDAMHRQYKQAPDGTARSRIAGVCPLMIKMASSFHMTLSPIQASNYSLDDILIEIYVVLLEKDHKWDGVHAYTTFSSMIARNLFSEIIDRSFTIHGPKNSYGRLAKYEKKREAGTLSSDERITETQIQGLRSGPTCIHEFDAEDEAEDEERTAQIESVRRAVAHAVAKLPPHEASIIGDAFGLWGKAPQSVEELSERSQVDPSVIRHMIARAKESMKRRLITHPVVLAYC